MNERDIFTLSCIMLIVISSVIVIIYKMFKDSINKYFKFVENIRLDNVEYRKNVRKTAEQIRCQQNEIESDNKSEN